MPFTQKIIDELAIVYPDTLTIAQLADTFASERAVIEDAVRELIEGDYPVKRDGHKLSLSCPLLSIRSINEQLHTRLIGSKMRLFSSLESTNSYAKENLSVIENGEVILAHEQTAGKGRLGREWTSPIGKSLSMSIVLKPSMNVENIAMLTQLTAAALVDALEKWASVHIKWPNDILLGKKKIGGILIETEFSGGSLEGIVLGIGLNTNLDQKDIPEELQSKATSIKQVTEKTVDPNELLWRFFTSFETYYADFLNTKNPAPFLSVCRRRSVLLGHDFWIINDSVRRKALIKDIDPSGALVVTYLDNGQTERITSTALSIRGEHGYI